MRASPVHRLFLGSGLLVLLLVAVRTFASLAPAPAGRSLLPFQIFFAATFIVFGTTFWRVTRGDLPSGWSAGRVALLLLQIAICSTVHTDLLVLLAAELPFVLPPRGAALWMGGQALVSAAIAAVLMRLGQFETDSDLARSPPAVQLVVSTLTIIAWQFLAFCVGFLAAAESRERRELARLNGELLATRELLAESSRLHERLEIARELHDTLGHHLTVLNVNLELARHLVEGPGSAPIAEAQAVTKLLLSDVREVVGGLREDGALDLSAALRTLAAFTEEPEVRLSVESGVAIGDPTKAHTLFRCAQEAITNSVRHARARTLHLELAAERGGVALRARDDGRGSDPIRPGNGLRGMRERLEAVGGTLRLESAGGRGFELTAWIPLGEGR